MNQNKNPFKNEFLEKNLQDDFIGEKLAKKRFFSRKIIVLISAVSLIIIIFVITPLIILGLIRNENPNVPTSHFVRMTDLQLENEVEDSTFFITTSTAEVTLRESLINQFIYNYILTNENRLYRQRTLCETDECRYIYHEYHPEDRERILIGVKDAWVTIEDDRVFFNLAVDYDDVIKLSTVIIMEIEITNNLNELKAQIVSIKLNRLRLPQTIVNQIIDVVGSNIEIELAEPYEGTLDINLNTLSISILQRNMRNLNDYSQYQVDDVIIKDGGIIFITKFSN